MSAYFRHLTHKNTFLSDNACDYDQTITFFFVKNAPFPGTFFFSLLCFLLSQQFLHPFTKCPVFRTLQLRISFQRLTHGLASLF